MFRYGKSSQNAIAAMSLLAECHAQGLRLSSIDIAKARKLPQTLVAKLLTQLSQAGLVTGSPGPHGGYALAKAPRRITLMEIAEIFDRGESRLICPFGPHWCGHGEPCPLHHEMVRMNDDFQNFLRRTSLAVFVQHPSGVTP